MKESDIERKGGDYARELGIAHYKFTSPARAAVPDRLVIAPIPEFLRPLIAQYIRFIEYKAPGQKATPAQQREHERLRALGMRVDVIDDPELARVTLATMGS